MNTKRFKYMLLALTLVPMVQVNAGTDAKTDVRTTIKKIVNSTGKIAQSTGFKISAAIVVAGGILVVLRNHLNNRVEEAAKVFVLFFGDLNDQQKKVVPAAGITGLFKNGNPSNLEPKSVTVIPNISNATLFELEAAYGRLKPSFGSTPWTWSADEKAYARKLILWHLSPRAYNELKSIVDRDPKVVEQLFPSFAQS